MKFTQINSNYYKLLIFLILISLTSSNLTKNRFLQYTEDNELNVNRNNTSEEKSSSSFEEDPGTFLLGAFFIFFFMGLYIV